ncbi:MAG TPA: class I SAM-dependent methyltransferase [Candidatus Angelobacter sp.]|jgi:cephalosporin hydroxylase|nr:class I SAM-dependent methyltransferase [Candidatus Angelobacter sp.]
MPSLKRLPLKFYNALHKRIWPVYRPVPSCPELKEIEEQALRIPSDISDYLGNIFSEVSALHPHLIVELGVRGGQSRSVLERAARISGSFLVSVDLDDCSAVCGKSPLWHFVKSDDIKFAGLFQDWCSQRSIESAIDVLFVDSSHLYEHTVEEIKAWFPFLSPNCKALFHDTNMRSFYRRLDGTIGHGWNNSRGVIKAIEESLGTKFNERIDFVTTVHGWVVRHWAHCNGFTTMERRSQ